MDRLRNDYRNLHLKKRSKIGWIETHYHQKELLKKSYASVVVTGDSIVAGLRRYPAIWRNFILQYKTVNLGTIGDRIENVLWRIKDILLPKSKDQSLYTVVPIISPLAGGLQEKLPRATNKFTSQSTKNYYA